MGYDYEMTYKKGKDNLVADALSTHLMTMLLFWLFLCLFQIGYNLFSKAMSMTLPYLKSSNSWLVILLLYRITLGMVLL